MTPKQYSSETLKLAEKLRKEYVKIEKKKAKKAKKIEINISKRVELEHKLVDNVLLDLSI